MRKYTIISVLVLVGISSVFSQGFVNLDFESENLSGYAAGSVPATNAIPDWMAYLGGIPLTNINYDVGASSGLGAYIYDNSALQGTYYVYIAGSVSQPASIGQTGTIPLTAQSLIWWGSGLAVSFNGQALPFSGIGLGPGNHYVIYAANISAYAGQTGQLLFTSTGLPTAPGGIVDNIQFSSSPIPEPGVLSLLGLGGLAYLWQRRKTRDVR